MNLQPQTDESLWSQKKQEKKKRRNVLEFLKAKFRSNIIIPTIVRYAKARTSEFGVVYRSSLSLNPHACTMKCIQGFRTRPDRERATRVADYMRPTTTTMNFAKPS